MKWKKWAVVFTAMVAVAAAIVFWLTPRGERAVPDARSEEFIALFEEFIHQADKVEFVFDGLHSPAIRVSAFAAAEAVPDLVAGITLDPKEPCKCLHMEGIVFWRGGEKLEASICDHCFDVMTTRGDGTLGRTYLYKMPPGLYEKFEKAKKELAERGRSEGEAMKSRNEPR